MTDVVSAPVSELFGQYVGVMNELRRRNVIRSENNPPGDYGELLFCRAFRWKQTHKSTTGYDAVDASGVRYQIKSRRLTSSNASRQLSAIRDSDNVPFDFLAAVLLGEDFRVVRAAMIPFEVVLRISSSDQHVNAIRLLLTDDVWDDPKVEDVTAALRAAEAEVLRSTSPL